MTNNIYNIQLSYPLLHFRSKLNVNSILGQNDIVNVNGKTGQRKYYGICPDALHEEVAYDLQLHISCKTIANTQKVKNQVLMDMIF